jgi:hypothetical protein
MPEGGAFVVWALLIVVPCPYHWGMDKVLGERQRKSQPKTDWFMMMIMAAIMGFLGWQLADVLFGNAIVSVCGGVITAAALTRWGYRRMDANWGPLG